MDGQEAAKEMKAQKEQEEIAAELADLRNSSDDGEALYEGLNSNA